MRKKLVAALLVGAVAVSSVIGLSACGVNINGGDKVSADEWKAAFKASLEAKNYTVDGYTNFEAQSSYLQNNDVRITEEEKMEITVKTTYDETNRKSYSERNGTYNTKTVTGSDKSTAKASEKVQNYIEFGDETSWLARYVYSEESGTAGKEMSETYWYAEEKYSVSSYVLADVSVLGTIYTTEKNSLLVQPLSNLYDAFTYEGGVYTATLWAFATTETKVSVSVRDGHVIGYQTEVTVDKKNGDDYEKSTRKVVYNFSNYGKTSVKAPGDATKAIEKAKKDN